jgi:hypothetical protein
MKATTDLLFLGSELERDGSARSRRGSMTVSQAIAAAQMV